jgi:pimeloyl-ACP methyl ester carboxylesterase
MYRQVTLQTLFSGQPATPEERALAYGDVVAAWKTYLDKYNDGRGVILIGHSQGTFVLRQMIHDYVDPKKGVRKRLISAILLGGNVLVKQGSTSGGDFKHIAACESPKQTGCVLAWSTFNAPVPDNALFGHARTTLDGSPATGEAVLCTNPAALGGGSGLLHTVYPSAPFAPGTTIGGATEAVGMPRPAVTTPWIQADAYTGTCSSADNANVLQISPLPGAPTLHPVPDATWGLHLVDANIALGNLTALVKREIKVYEKEQEAD